MDSDLGEALSERFDAFSSGSTGEGDQSMKIKKVDKKRGLVMSKKVNLLDTQLTLAEK